MIRDQIHDIAGVAQWVAAAQVAAATALCVIGRSDAPPMRHAARGCRPVPADVRTDVERAPDAWPVPSVQDVVPTRPLTWRDLHPFPPGMRVER